MSEFLNPPRLQIAAQRMLRCRKTNRYFTGNGWSDNPAEAKLFWDEFDAALACVQKDLNDVDLVLSVSVSGRRTEIIRTEVK